MTDCQKLLQEFAETASESAFRELVGCYVNLVYSTALRVVRGDSHLAEDVSQTVFIGLARNAGSISREVMLGGWLYRHTYHVATKAVRREERRHAREREAVEMNTLQNDPDEIANRVRPILDEALMHLGDEDRKAILLRFFEELDFRAVGAGLNVSEDAARMRVSRAVDKLHAILTRRGIVLPVVGLSAALSIEAARGAPSGLAAKLASSAITAGTGGGIMHTTFVNIMNATKIKAGLVGVIIAASVVTSLIIQQSATGKIRELDAALGRQSSQATALAADNNLLSNDLARAEIEKGKLEELQRLRAEANALQLETNKLTSLREEHSRLRQELQSLAQTPLQKKEASMARMKFEMQFLQAMQAFENKNGRTPSGFDEAAPFLPKDSDAATSPLRDNFEWVYSLPNTWSATNFHDVIAIREIDPTVNSDGTETKAYGFVDGHCQITMMPSMWNGITYNTFEAYENAHILPPPQK
jgi:RNA polymerase sigma factor (sigma-70 family)